MLPHQWQRRRPECLHARPPLVQLVGRSDTSGCKVTLHTWGQLPNSPPPRRFSPRSATSSTITLQRFVSPPTRGERSKHPTNFIAMTNVETNWRGGSSNPLEESSQGNSIENIHSMYVCVLRTTRARKKCVRVCAQHVARDRSGGFCRRVQRSTSRVQRCGASNTRTLLDAQIFSRVRSARANATHIERARSSASELSARRAVSQHARNARG